jgi:Fe-S-cluster containining protein
MSQLIGECIEGCGACCDPVMLAAPHLQQALLPSLSARDRRWMLEDLVAMPAKEAAAKTAWMRARPTVGFVEGRLSRETFFYRCRQFDAETRACRSHDDLPSACGGFPWHGGVPHPDAALPPECGYNVDVGRVPVEITRKPDSRHSGVLGR